MTITQPRLRELIRFADDRAADTTQDYQTIQAHRDIAAALRERNALTERLKAVEAENERLRDLCSRASAQFCTAIRGCADRELIHELDRSALNATTGEGHD